MGGRSSITGCPGRERQSIVDLGKPRSGRSMFDEGQPACLFYSIKQNGAVIVARERKRERERYIHIYIHNDFRTKGRKDLGIPSASIEIITKSNGRKKKKGELISNKEKKNGWGE